MLVVKVPIFVILFLMAGFAQGFMQSIKKSKNQKIRRRKGFMLVFFLLQLLHCAPQDPVSRPKVKMQKGQKRNTPGVLPP